MSDEDLRNLAERLASAGSHYGIPGERDCADAASAILGLLESRAIMDGAADELGRQLAAAEAALQSSKLDCLSLETQLAETQARLARAVEALQRLGRTGAFHVATRSIPPELMIRIEYARSILQELGETDGHG